MTPPTVLLLALVCLLSMPQLSNAHEKDCKETKGRYTQEQRDNLFEAVVKVMDQEPRTLYTCSLEALAAKIWDDSGAEREKLIKHNIKEFKYKGETSADFVTVAANKWKDRFHRKKEVKKIYGGCFYGEKDNGKSKAVCLFI
ncbi:hypothetical protein Y032_0473g2087 [Ancylostoma ceylanicum]|uniref:SCP domain-containing protein n=1 Tax=Ancylostoma ceylanicum TaxID=53326 RepID=A0A016WYH6_9BILA|nr:hypothetical protein Y032_0473g2087 [Ancylostoma ceylanicum]